MGLFSNLSAGQKISKERFDDESENKSSDSTDYGCSVVGGNVFSAAQEIHGPRFLSGIGNDLKSGTDFLGYGALFSPADTA